MFVRCCYIYRPRQFSFCSTDIIIMFKMNILGRCIFACTWPGMLLYSSVVNSSITAKKVMNFHFVTILNAILDANIANDLTATCICSEKFAAFQRRLGSKPCSSADHHCQFSPALRDWNNIPINIRELPTIDTFKRQLKLYMKSNT